MRVLTLDVNGDRQETAAPDHWTLLEVLRYKLGLTGSKQGCDKGDCGACTVLVEGKPTLACCSLAVMSQGAEITTIEGLPPKLPRAFDISGALQCGFCQPGMMLSAKALLAEVEQPTLNETRAALAGNLCRCTGYTQIFQAIDRVACERTGQEPTPPSWAKTEENTEQ